MADVSTFDLQLVPARAVDVDRIAAVVNAAFRIYPFMGGDRTSAEGVTEEMGDNGEFITAIDNGLVVGCAMFRPSVDVDWGMEGEDSICEVDAVYLGLVAVEPTIRKRGLGRRMVAEAERIGRERGYRRLVLGTLVEMGNVVYYEALGYAVDARKRFEAGHWGLPIDHDYCVMVKTL
ncbi:MAG: GNAT family N-acetyltransferase [Tepidiformaceae bacterium]